MAAGRRLFLIDGLGEPRGAERRGEARGLCCLFGVRAICRTAFLLLFLNVARLKTSRYKESKTGLWSHNKKIKPAPQAP
jgi:hypothetical protein